MENDKWKMIRYCMRPINFRVRSPTVREGNRNVNVPSLTVGLLTQIENRFHGGRIRTKQARLQNGAGLFDVVCHSGGHPGLCLLRDVSESCDHADSGSPRRED